MTRPPPRVLLVMPDQWPRAMVRAELRERGYDAVGARSLLEALVLEREPARGPVRAILIDQRAVARGGRRLLARVRERYPGVALLLIGSAVVDPGTGAWNRVLRRPASVGAVVAAIRELVPLPPGATHPVDR